jgi:hypothetical protein
MNLYASTVQGIRAARAKRHDRLLREMAAAATRKAEGLEFDIGNKSWRHPIMFLKRSKPANPPRRSPPKNQSSSDVDRN